jgi:mannose-1-phosphate guanylyltransferase
MQVAGGASLLQRTFDRAQALPSVAGTAIVTNVAYSYKTVEELQARPGSETLTLLLEPKGRNTAPAVALAALWAAQVHGSDAILVVLPADHLIASDDEFRRAATEAIQLAASRQDLVLFGISPSGPETGFGYIEAGDLIGQGDARHVRRFVEKPDRVRAEEYVAKGNFVWNSGMFCFQAGAILRAMDGFAPDVAQAARRAMAEADVTEGQVSFRAESFLQQPDISIDYAVMERADNVAVLPCKFGWSDIGSWKAVSEASHSDGSGNTTEGNAILINSQRTFVRSEGRLVAVVGVSDLVVIDTADAVLVAHKEASQSVKDVVMRLKQLGHAAAKEHSTVYRPWGSYTTITEDAGFKVKRIVVKPGQSLSLQLHHQRAEHWVVTRGEAIVQIGEVEYPTCVGEHRYIPLGEKHRLSNRTSGDVEIVEVQIGGYLGEDDIVRLVDSYGRV